MHSIANLWISLALTAFLTLFMTSCATALFEDYDLPDKKIAKFKHKDGNWSGEIITEVQHKSGNSTDVYKIKARHEDNNWADEIITEAGHDDDDWLDEIITEAGHDDDDWLDEIITEAGHNDDDWLDEILTESIQNGGDLSDDEVITEAVHDDDDWSDDEIITKAVHKDDDWSDDEIITEDPDPLSWFKWTLPTFEPFTISPLKPDDDSRKHHTYLNGTTAKIMIFIPILLGLTLIFVCWKRRRRHNSPGSSTHASQSTVHALSRQCPTSVVHLSQNPASTQTSGVQRNANLRMMFAMGNSDSDGTSGGFRNSNKSRSNDNKVPPSDRAPFRPVLIISNMTNR